MNHQYKVQNFSDIYHGTIQIYSGRIVSCKSHPIRTRFTKDSVAILNLEKNTSIPSRLDAKTLLSQVDKTDALYIFPKCKIARDHYRKSGYRIVRDADKATMCIVPQCDDVNKFYYDVIAKNEDNDLFLYTVCEYRTFSRVSNDCGMFPTIKSYLESKCKEVLSTSICEKEMAIIPNGTGWLEMILDSYPDRNYIEENFVTFDAATEISPEVLRIWEGSDQSDILPGVICQSNWRDYPFTLFCFLMFIEYYPAAPNISKDFKFVLDSIGYFHNRNLDNYSKPISAKDWNMLQDWIMYRCTPELSCSFDAIPNKMDYLLQLCRSKCIIAPLHISDTITLANAKALLK